MRRRLIATAQCRGRPVRYYLLADGVRDGKRMYGILVERGGDQELIPEIAPSRWRVQALLERLARGRVTPVTVRDAVEDWLLT